MVAKVPNTLAVGAQITPDVFSITLYLSYAVAALQNWVALAATRLNSMFPKDGSEGLTVYTTATKPAATTANQGAIIYVSDGGVGNVFQGSNGSIWVSLG